MLTKDTTDQEIEKAQADFYRDLSILDYKYIDVVREDWGFKPDDDSATFGDNMENRWSNFVKNHVVLDNLKETILYEDKDKRWRLIPGRVPELSDLEFIIANFERIYLEDEELESLDLLPSLTILGIEAKSSLKYDEHNVNYTNKIFFVTQLLITTREILEFIKSFKTTLKKHDNQLFKDLEQKYNEVFE